MRFEDLNWFDVENYLQHDNRIMIVLGSCEQHAYLSLLSDVRIPMALADSASRKTNVLVAPSLNFGISPYFLEYPGTISLRASTLIDIVEDIVRSLHHHGFRKLLFINGHGGNSPAQSRLYELSNEFTDLSIAWYAWWQSHSVQLIAQKYRLKPAHASWLEAFKLNIVAELPKEPKPPPFVAGLLNAEMSKSAYGDGNFGGPYSVDDSIMEEVFNACLLDILEMLNFKVSGENMV